LLVCVRRIRVYSSCEIIFANFGRNQLSSIFYFSKKLICDKIEVAGNMRSERLVRRSVLDKIFHEMIAIRCRLDDLERNMSSWSPEPLHISDSNLLLLPDHLRRSYMIVASRGECAAELVSNLTGRSRAIESNYLNQLTRMGWLNKRRVCKTINFRVVPQKNTTSRDSLNEKVRIGFKS